MVRERFKKGKIDRKVLDGYVANAFVGFLTAEEVKALAGTLRLTVEELTLNLLPLVAERAIAPVSGFRVGAIGRGISGNLYFGVNLEFSGDAIGAAVHAEQAAVAFALFKGEQGLRALTVSAPPCGLCRQFLNELNTAETLKIQWPGIDPLPLSALLPEAFGPSQLKVKQRLMDPQQHPLALKNDSPSPLTNAALAAARAAYAPYSGCFCGVALETTSGRIYIGSYAENAAFNPSLLTLQAALIGMVMSGGRYADIVRGTLVHVEPSRIDLTATTRKTLETLTHLPLTVEYARNVTA